MRTGRSTSTILMAATVVAVVLATRADLPAGAVGRTVTIPIAGIIYGAPESVALAGTIAIGATPVTDQVDGSKQRLVLELVDVSGVGLVSGAKYVAAGDVSLVRRLAASDQIEIMFPFFPATVDGPLSARPAAASIGLKFDPTGGITKANASFSAPTVLGR